MVTTALGFHRVKRTRDQRCKSIQRIGFLNIIGMPIVYSFDAGNRMAQNALRNMGHHAGSSHE